MQEKYSNSSDSEVFRERPGVNIISPSEERTLSPVRKDSYGVEFSLASMSIGSQGTDNFFAIPSYANSGSGFFDGYDIIQGGRNKNGDLVEYGRAKIYPDDSLLIGRTAFSDPGSRFSRLSSAASRRHLQVKMLKDGSLNIHDLGSTNGVAYRYIDRDLNEIEPMGYRTQTSRIGRGALEMVDLHSSVTSDLYEPRTLAGVRVLSSGDVDASVYRIVSHQEQSRGTTELLANRDLRPVAGVDLGSGEVLVSEVFTDKYRKMAVGYQVPSSTESTDGQQLIPFLFYKSNSDGGWRSSPGISASGRFSKGKFDGSEFGQYVSVTKPVESLVSLLEGMESRKAMKHFTVDDIQEYLRAPMPYSEGSIEDQVRFTKVESRGLEAFLAGVGYKDRDGVGPGAVRGREMLEGIELPRGFEPDFTANAKGFYSTEHTLLGKSKVEVYGAELNNRQVEWHIASDRRGRVWLERLTYTDSEVTTYGTQKEVILAGALNMKPIEYASQVRGGEEGADYIDIGHHTYVDLWPTIRRMPWVKRYIQARLDKMGR